jgi:hypothetical protein
MEPTTPLADLVDGKVAEGWVPAKITAQGLLELDEGQATLDSSNVYQKLQDAFSKGLDRAHVKLRGQLVPDAAAYRQQKAHVGLTAMDAVVYTSHRPRYLAYGLPPKGSPGGRAGAAGIIIRSFIWLVALGIVLAVSLVPLIEALISD